VTIRITNVSEWHPGIVDYVRSGDRARIIVEPGETRTETVDEVAKHSPYVTVELIEAIA
jgi:hypothetical protein